MARRGRWTAVGLSGMAIAWGLGAFTPSHAVPEGVTLAAPYAVAEHSTNVACPGADPIAACRAASDADPAGGRLSVSSTVDSGLNGTAPSSSASAVGNADVGAGVAIDPAQRLTIAFHVHVADLALAATKDGRTHLVVWASAACDGCTTPRAQLSLPTQNGDLTLSLSVTNGSSAVQSARLFLGASADARIDCHDFCAATTGTARTSATVTLASIDAFPA